MSESEEIQFFDYFVVLWRRKALVLAGAFVTMIAVGAWNLTTPPVYETSLNLQLGRIWGQPIDNIGLLTSRILSEAFLSRATEKLDWLRNSGITPRDLLLGNMMSTVANEGAGLIVVKARSDEPKRALELVNAVADLITQEHKVLYESKAKEQSDYQKKLEVKIQGIESELKELQKLLGGSRDPSANNALVVLLVQAQIVEKESSVVAYARELHEVLVNNNSKIQTNMTQVVDPPLLPQRPESRGLARSVATSGVLGILGFAFIGFFIEFIEKSKRRNGHG